MEVNNKRRFYRLFWFWNIIKNGLFLLGVKNRLARIGFDFMPYYFVEEGIGEFDAPVIRGDDSSFTLSYFKEKELSYIQNEIKGIEHKDLLEDYKNGQICVGLKHNDEIAAYMLIKRKDYFFRGRRFEFKDNEAYLHSMYTFESYRGRNLAPYLRYKSYGFIKEKGVDTKYSISEYFNKSTIKFKNKLNSKHLKLYLSVILFKKIHWNFLLKTYK